MSGEKSSTWANALLALVFQNTAAANIGNTGGLQPSTVAGSLYFSLHTADPGPGGNQSTSEIAYTSYARVAVARSSGGFTVTTNSVSPAAAVNFPTGTGGSGTAAFFGIGTASSGAGELLYSGPISPTIVTGNGVTPQLTTATAVTES
jgi:hypothetical protein